MCLWNTTLNGATPAQGDSSAKRTTADHPMMRSQVVARDTRNHLACRDVSGLVPMTTGTTAQQSCRCI